RIRLLLVPGEATLRRFALEQQLVLPAGRAGGEDDRAGGAALEAEQQDGVALERLAGELGEDLGDPQSGHVLREVEPVRAEVADDVRRTGRGRVVAPARRHQEDGVAGVAAVYRI